ncbi:MAG: hypothetical protein WA700_16090 [Acidobacteriaceae bacterium]
MALISLAVIARFAVTCFVVVRLAVICFAETILPVATELLAGEDFVLEDFGAGLLLIRDFFAMAMSDSWIEVEISWLRTPLMHPACQTFRIASIFRNSLNPHRQGEKPISGIGRFYLRTGEK